MQKFNYKLKTFVKVVTKIVEEKKCELRIIQKSGAGMRFEIFRKGSSEIENFWVLHCHDGKKITSKKDYQKVAYQLGITLEKLIEAIEEEI